MRLFRPVPRRVARAVSLLAIAAWVVTMGVVLNRAYLQARSFNLATDLRALRIRGRVARRLLSRREDRLQRQPDQPGTRRLRAAGGRAPPDVASRRNDAGADSHVRAARSGVHAALVRLLARSRHRRRARDRPRLGAAHQPHDHDPGGTQTEERDLADVPVLSINLPRRLAALGFKPGTQQKFVVFDPATLSSETVTIAVGKREIVNVYAPGVVSFGNQSIRSRTNRPIPAFRVDLAFAGLQTSSWVTDTGEVVREESPLGLLTVREAPEEAQRLAIGGRIQGDLLESAAVQPRRSTKNRIDDPRDVRRIRIRIEGADLESPEMRGAGQSVEGTCWRSSTRALAARGAGGPRRRPLPSAGAAHRKRRSRHPRRSRGGGRGVDRSAAQGRTARAARQRHARQEADRQPAVRRAKCCGPRSGLQRAHRAVRRDGPRRRHSRAHRRRPGLFARRVLLPRVARGLHRRGRGRGLWLPVDPTFNQFPADATHVRMTRGGLDRQAAILPLIGHLKMNIVDLELAPNSTPILVGRGSIDAGPMSVPFPVRTGMTCWSSPRPRAPMIAITNLVKRYGDVHRGRRRQPRSCPERSTASSVPNGAGKTTTIRMIAGLLEADLGDDPRQQSRPRDPCRGGEGVARLHPRSSVHLREADGRGVPALPRRALRHGRCDRRRARARDARAVRARASGSTSWSRASRTA